MQELIEKNREMIAELCRQHHVRSLSVFGSAARDDFDPERSDVDLLVEFEELPYPQSAENHDAMRQRLSLLFARSVDLILAGTIRNPYIRHEIESERKTVYAA